MVHKEHFLFHIKIEINSNFWYNVSPKTHYCNCPDMVSTCKHIFGVQSIVNEFIEKTKHSKFVEKILYMESNMETIDVMSPSQVGEPMEDATSNDVIREKILNSLSELDSLCKASLDVDNEDEIKRRLQALQACIATFLEPSSFERPETIDLPSEVLFLPYKRM